MEDFQWYNDAIEMTPLFQNQDGEKDSDYPLPSANPRQTEYNFGIHVPEVIPPYPVTLGYGTIPTRPGFLTTPAGALSPGVSITQPDNRQVGFPVFPSNSSMKDANMEEAKTVQVVIRPRRNRERKREKAPTPLPLEKRKCQVCGEEFDSRNKLFEEHVNVAGACRDNQDPFMGWSSPRVWE
ncbi:hypothetical protein FMUND_10021 [Fusarium mundagurra]|uniref:Uncharacterized protein n=1 Tax=Fusarium mundagurra TaxID=1567541 RepID=A0A8H5YDW8_9HYPO|nr:hypothetical protein FMUND_10021 [Fusarium mundagurra]